MSKLRWGVLAILIGLLALSPVVDVRATPELTTDTGAPVHYTAPGEIDIPVIRMNGSVIGTVAPIIWVVRANQALGASTVIQHASRKDVTEIINISSTGGAITSTASPLRIAAGLDGQTIIIRGTSAANTYTLPDGNGVKLASATSILFDDRTSMFFSYDLGLGTWRQDVTIAGAGGGGGTAAATAFTPTGGITETNVQTGMAGIDTRMEKGALKNANSGYLGLNPAGKATWDRTGSYAPHASDISAGSQIDAATLAVQTIGIQSSAAGNITMTTGNPRITGCTLARDGTIIYLRGLSAAKTVTIPTGQGVRLAGNTGSVIVGLNLTPVGFQCNGTSLEWEQILVPSPQDVFKVSNKILTGSTAATGFITGDFANGNYCSDFWDAANSNLPTRQCFCGGGACDNVIQLSAGKSLLVLKPAGAGVAFSVSDAGVVSGAAFDNVLIGNTSTGNAACAGGGGATNYFSVLGRTGGAGQAEPLSRQPYPKAGKAYKIFVALATGSTVPPGETVVWTLRKNAANTALTCPIAAGGSTCTLTLTPGNEVAIAANDFISLQSLCTGGTTNLAEVSWGILVQ